MSWQAIVSSAMGTSHIDSGICQDAGDFEIIEDGELIIAAISDGIGSAKYSQIGAENAVRFVIDSLKQIQWELQCVDKAFANNTFRQLLISVKNEISYQAHKKKCNIHDLACTLIAFVASPNWIAAMQVGDGLLVGRSSSGEYELLIEPDKGEYINETTSITDINALINLRIYVEPIRFGFICAATDGVENISLVKDSNWRPFKGFFKPLDTHLRSSKSQPQKTKELDCLLNSERINKTTNDDKTLLISSYEEINSNRCITEVDSYSNQAIDNDQMFNEDDKSTSNHRRRLIEGGGIIESQLEILHNQRLDSSDSEYECESYNQEYSENKSKGLLGSIHSILINKRKLYNFRKIISKYIGIDKNLSKHDIKNLTDKDITKLQRYILSDLESIGFHEISSNIIVDIKARNLDFLKITIISSVPIRRRNKLKEIIKNHINKLSYLSPKRVSIFNLSYSSKSKKVLLSEYFRLINFLEIFKTASVVSGFISFIFLILVMFDLIELKLSDLLIILSYFNFPIFVILFSLYE